jgi:hypothetical protein
VKALRWLLLPFPRNSSAAQPHLRVARRLEAFCDGSLQIALPQTSVISTLTHKGLS